ncbi:MAG: hypothetical protein JWO13_1215 [Acidobacteriales bacterium]|nr:hypothetical protein [Terriglobales bacterium]
MLFFPKALFTFILTITFCCASSAQEGGTPTSLKREKDRVAEREAWFRSGRRVKGENTSDLLHRAYKQKLKIHEERIKREAAAAAKRGESGSANPEQSTTPNFANQIWKSLGPKPTIFDATNAYGYGAVTGRVSAIVVDPKDSTGNTVYIGGASGGVWKSTNAANSDVNAVTWQPLIDDQPSLAVGAIAIQPGTNTILVGTGETNSSPDSYYGMGILRSTDAGQSWTLIPDANNHTRSFRGLGFSKIAFSTLNPNLVVASAASTNGATPGGNGAEIQGADGRGIYVSNDAGQTWAYADVQDPDGTIQAGSVGDIVFNPQHGKFYAVVRWHGYYSSVDGFTWTRLGNQPGAITSAGCPGNPVSRNCAEYRGSLSVREDTGDVYTIFVDAFGNTNAGGGVFVLQSNGGAWAQLGEQGIDACGDTDGCGTEQGTYNLYIKAIPNGSNTDLYVGAINIFKCSRSLGDPNCTTSTSWKNLTHVYGCAPFGSISGVHPDQHAIDFSRGAFPTRIYFGNDGGLYRALDGSGLTSSNCADSNPFDNLNAGIGSFSEFVSFSQHPTNPGILLGGLQDNGSPALDPNNAGVQGTTWRGIHVGDGGYNAIDPNTPTIYFASYPDINVQRCASGTSCVEGLWTDVVTANRVGNDGASFYPPFILDPAISTKLFFGTCRLWTGNTLGGNYNAISNNFAFGGATQCAGGTSTGDTKIRSIAAGGPVSANGSQVIYVGMGAGDPIQGHLFVTTNADSGPTSWIDRTANINPSGYDISDIAVSPFDSSGSTAYVAIMGFGTSHVFKTTNAGATWTDKNANLPDSPANSVVIDPTNANIIYVGTDIGVFVSIDDGASWADFGSAMPNVPVVKLKTFVSGNVKKLRAATYGRGLWEIDLATPDVNFAVAGLAFSTVIGRTSATKQTTLANNTANPITITSIAATGDFSATNDCPAVLSPGNACNVFVIFSPYSAGLRTNSLVLTSNAPGGARTISLTGNGIDFALTMTRPARPQRSAASVTAEVTRANPAFEVVFSASTDTSLDSVPESERQVEMQCVAPRRVSCTVAASSIEVGGAPISARITLGVSRDGAPKRLQGNRLAVGRYTVKLRAISGTVVRTQNATISVK